MFSKIISGEEDNSFSHRTRAKHFSREVWRNWLKLSGPDRRLFGKQLVEQERLRRARLLSALLPLLGVAILIVVPSALVEPLLWISLGIHGFSGCGIIWLNRRGLVDAAGLLFVSSIDVTLISVFLAQPQGISRGLAGNGG